MLGRADVIRRYAPCGLWLGVFSTSLCGSACSTDHDALALQPRGGAGGSAGAGGGGAGGVPSVAGQTSSGGRVNADVEPAGDNVLTIVNGVVDAESVALCFARVSDDGESSELRGDPLTELGYAASKVLTELPDFSFADDTIEPWVIAGDLSLIDGLDCADAVELAQGEEAKVTPDPEAEPPKKAPPPPALRARPVAALPAGTVDIGRSILMVLTGCMGGAAYTYSEELGPRICGDDYAPDLPTLQPLVVKLSREHRYSTVGLQGMHASVATGSLDVRASGDGGRVALVFASSIRFGAVEPRPADTRFSPSELGIDAGDYGLQAVDYFAKVVFEQPWTDVLGASGLPGVTANRTYTAIFLGPDPTVKTRDFWNPAAFALVDNDPTREEPPAQ